MFARSWKSTVALLGLALGVFSSPAAAVDEDLRHELTVGRNADKNQRVATWDDAATNFSQMDSWGSTWGSGHYTTGVAYGDIDGDGVDELAVSRKTSANSRIYVFRIKSNGQYESIWEHGDGWGSSRYGTDVAFGDIDGDGKDELAYARKAGSNQRFAVIRFDTSGSSVSGSHIYTGGEVWGATNYATAVAFGDADGDGKDELAVARESETNQRVQVISWGTSSSGKQVWTVGEEWASANFGTNVAWGDVDGDGREELGYTRKASKNGRFYVRSFRREGSNFVSTLRYSGGHVWASSNYGTAAAFGDIDGDGIDELAIARKASANERVKLVRWNGPDSAREIWSKGEQWASGNHATDVAFGDSDGDGHDELAIAREASKNGRFYIWDVRWIRDSQSTSEDLVFSWGHDWDSDNYATTLAFAGSRSVPPLIDSDRDGLADWEEQAGGIDVDHDGRVDGPEDIRFSTLHGVAADPNVPDIYVEVDWADCTATDPDNGFGRCAVVDVDTGAPDERDFEPPQGVLDLVEAEFARNGINLHFVKNEPFPATAGNLVTGPTGTTVDSAYFAANANDNSIHERIYDLYFGDSGDSEATIAAKAKFMRYNTWSHQTDQNQNGGRWGIAPRFDKHLLVGLDVNKPAIYEFAYPPSGRAIGDVAPALSVDPSESFQLWAIVLMHELGHSLRLLHNGDVDYCNDNECRVPTYESIMNPLRRDDVDGNNISVAVPQLRFNEQDRGLNQCAIRDDLGVPGNESFTVMYSCPNRTRTIGFGGAIDWDCDGITASTVNSLSVLPHMCVRATNNVVTPALVSDDVLWGGVIQNSVAGMPPNSVAAPTDVVIGAQITPGADGILNTPVAAGDVLMGGRIESGPDNTCNTGAPLDGNGLVLPGYAQIFGVGSVRVAEPPRRPEEVDLCNLRAHDDWDFIRDNIQLATPRIGNSATSSSLREGTPIEPTLDEIREHQKRHAVVDLEVSGGSTAFDKANRTFEISFNITNPSVFATGASGLNVELPEGLELSSCSGSSEAKCYQYDGIISVGLDSIPARSTREVTMSFFASCPRAGEVFDVGAELVSVTRDPNTTNNTISFSVEFEDALAVDRPGHPWLFSYSGGVPVSIDPSQRALVLSPGYNQIESPTFDTLELGSVGEEILVDVFIPAVSWPGWVGDLQLHVDVPAGSLWNAWVGSVNYNSLPIGSWQTLSFAVPAGVQAVLLEDHPDARIRLSGSIAQPGADILVRNVRFSDNVICQEPRQPAGPVTSTSVLRFESLQDWSSDSAVLHSSLLTTEGNAALGFSPGSWGQLVSRKFSASELQGVTSTLSFDVRLPDLPADYYWLGGMNVFVECPNVSLWRTWLGYQALQILFDDQYNRVEFPVPQPVLDAWSAPSAECQLFLEFATNSNYTDFVIDNGGFVQ